MSIKKFNPDKDFTYGTSPFTHNNWIWNTYFSGGNNASNCRIENAFNYGGVSGGWCAEIYDRELAPSLRASREGPIRLSTVTYGFTSASSYFKDTDPHRNAKTTIYRLHAKILLGDPNKKFIIQNKELDEAIFLSFDRSQVRDGIVSEHTYIQYNFSGGFGSYYGTDLTTSMLTDDRSYLNAYGGGRSPTFKEYGGEASYLLNVREKTSRAILFSQVGSVVIDPIIFSTNNWSGSADYVGLAQSTNGINDLLSALRFKFGPDNETNGAITVFKTNAKVNNTYHSCVAEKDEFNYSSNKTFVNRDGVIRTSISSSTGNASTYITTVVLFDANQQPLAVAKTSSPIKKNNQSKVNIIVRINY